jgi:hypothetical protein
MLDIINWVSENHIVLLSILTGAVTVASLVASVTPTPKDDTFVAKVYKYLDLLALNVGRAKEKGKHDNK